jgi:signal peptidase II
MTLARNRWLSLGVLAVLAADWLSKFWVQNRFHLGSQHAVVEGWVWLAHRENPGVAFSFFAELPDTWRVPLLVAASAIGVVVAAWILVTTHDAWVRIAAGLVIAGALGNLGDRVANGAVTDFILIRFFPFVFNVADIAITVGAVLLAARLMLEEQQQTGTPAGPAEEAAA